MKINKNNIKKVENKAKTPLFTYGSVPRLKIFRGGVYISKSIK
ncbi:hypothetical protein DK150_370076 [Flavobacterium psychrophilum]|nr:hypothetical protein DK150_370076 [Flavobacterium psychrophilum]